ncbi:MAG: YqaA family protein [Bryobacteraceae bacterium]
MLAGVDALVVVLAAVHGSSAIAGATMAVIGSVLGSLILFGIARKGGDVYLTRHTISRRAQLLRRWFARYGLLTIFVPALIPIPMPLKVFVISAGALGISPVLFAAVLTVARIIRYFGLALLAMELGDQTLPYLKHHLVELFIIAGAILVTLYLLIRWVERKDPLTHGGDSM